MELGTDVQVQMAGELKEPSSGENLPSLLVQVPSRTIAGFDCVGHDTTATLSSVVSSVPPHDDTQLIPCSLSLSMPASPSGCHFSHFRTASVHRDDDAPSETKPAEVLAHSPRLLKQTRFYSQPILHASQLLKGGASRRADGTRDNRFDPFKTFSGRLERQLSNLRGLSP